MAKYFRYFETIAEFESAYTGEEYVEPFVAYIEENQGVAFNKAQLLNIEIVGLAMKNDAPATGKTVDKNDCEYTVLGFYDDSTEKDITDEATVTGSLVVEASQIEERHSAGTLTLTATYDEFEARKSIVVFQEAFVPTLTAITLDDLTWEEDIPAEGGTATKDNCSYTVTAYYDNGNEVDVTDEAVVTGTLVVEESELDERHSAGTLTLTAAYSGFNDSASVTVWQEAAVSYLTFNITSGGDISWGCAGESGVTIEYKKNNGEWTEITATPLNPQTMTGGTKINVVAGDKVQFRGDNAAYSLGGGMPIGTFAASTAGFTLEGNIMSLIDSVNYKEITGMTNDNVGAFAFLFIMCTGLTSAENLMLPAITLAEACYGGMFNGCTSLTTAPALPAATLAGACYSSMFNGCTSLNYIKCLATDISAEGCTAGWVDGVSYSGTFIKNPTMNDWEIDSLDGIPEGWSVYDRDPLKLSVTQVSFAESGDSCTITVKSPTSAWTATSEDSWISFNKISGNTGETSVIVSTSSGTKRVGEVLFTDGYSQATLTVVQNNDYLVPLTFNILSNGEVGFAVRNGNEDPTISGSIIEYKINDGDWTSLAAKPFTGETEMGFDSKFSVNAGDVVQFRGDNKAYVWYDLVEKDFYQNWFVTSAEFNLAGNIMSLTNSTDFIHNGNMGYEAFSSLFSDCENLVSAENLILPATTLAAYCYNGMFQGCSSLTTAPELPATTLANGCYYYMFQGCSSLTTAPELPATTLASYCYQGMFSNCTGLTTAPALPATTLAGSCYNSMFERCTSLTTAPELPATTLADWCYNSMFSGCTSLNYIKCLATDISATNCTRDWAYNVSSTGTFVKPASMTNWTRGQDGIPYNWTVEDAS